MQDVFVGFVLDQSGSMLHGREETLKGFNAFKEEQAAQPGNAFMTLVLFADQPTIRINGGDMKLIDDLGTPANPYGPSGSTALYDAAATTIHEMEEWLNQNSSFVGQKIVVILTDGYENSSKKTSLPVLNALITDKKENEGWEFVFMGSGQAAWTEGQKLQINQDTVLGYADNTASVRSYAGVTSSLTKGRAGGQSLSSTLSAWKKEDQADQAAEPPTQP